MTTKIILVVMAIDNFSNYPVLLTCTIVHSICVKYMKMDSTKQIQKYTLRDVENIFTDAAPKYLSSSFSCLFVIPSKIKKRFHFKNIY